MNIQCFFGFHKLYVIERFSSESRKIGCKRCDKAWAMNDYVQTVLEWDNDFQVLHYGKKDRNKNYKPVPPYDPRVSQGGNLSEKQRRIDQAAHDKWAAEFSQNKPIS